MRAGFTYAPLILWCCPVASIAPEQANDGDPFRWGPYRPNLYFGVRPQLPDTLLTGMMWGQGRTKATLIQSLHDTCEQDDGIEGFGWSMYDTRLGGTQMIHDGEGHVDIQTDFVKTSDGESWGVRVSGSPRPDARGSVATAVVFHVAHEKAEDNSTKSLECSRGDEDASIAVCRGSDPALGAFELHATGDADNQLVQTPAIKSLWVPEESIWKAKAVFTDQVLGVQGSQKEYLVDEPGKGNMHFIQMVFEAPFTVTFTYRSEAATLLSPDSIKSRISGFQTGFVQDVDRVFPRARPFDREKYAEFGKSLLSNLLGGLGFFHGDSKVDYTNAPEYLETDLNFWEKAAQAMDRATITSTPPASLLSHSPSRPIFPRGFLWDEGFHLLPVIEWDLDLAVSVLQSWLRLVDDDGWIAREQILGPEARSRVPEAFQVQYPHYANPPTLALLFPILVAKLRSPATYAGHPSKYLTSPEDAAAMLGELYPLLARHYGWFRRTQAGNFTEAYPRPAEAIVGEGFRWRGRTPEHTLTSGLDDYPRADPPHPGELHVDALAWVAAAAQSLQQVATHLGLHEDAARYAEDLAAAQHNLDALHWDPVEAAYCDATIVHDENENESQQRFERVCRLGYVSLLPLLLGLMGPDHPHLSAVMDLLADPDRLWAASHGLRSLSAADPAYSRGEDYWRGAVWAHLNVLAVLRLRDLGAREEGGPVRARAWMLAAQLRKSVVGTVYESWARTGLFWEQYSDTTGEGRRSRAFTGWTACVVLLLGLDFGAEAEGGSGVSGTTAVVSALLFASFLLVATTFRRRLVSLGARVVELWRTRGAQGRHRGEYEEVIDLDEQDFRRSY